MVVLSFVLSCGSRVSRCAFVSRWGRCRGYIRAAQQTEMTYHRISVMVATRMCFCLSLTLCTIAMEMFFFFFYHASPWLSGGVYLLHNTNGAAMFCTVADVFSSAAGGWSAAGLDSNVAPASYISRCFSARLRNVKFDGLSV